MDDPLASYHQVEIGDISYFEKRSKLPILNDFLREVLMEKDLIGHCTGSFDI